MTIFHGLYSYKMMSINMFKTQVEPIIFGIRCIFFSYEITGSPSSKYEHRRASALLRNIQNIRICMGKKTFVSETYENERISIKNSLPYLKCVLSCFLLKSFHFRRFQKRKFFFPYKSLYFECYATMPMLADAHISSLGYL